MDKSREAGLLVLEKQTSKKFNIISDLYVKNNFPGLEKLLLLVKRDNNKITRKEIKEFLESQYNYQLLKVQNTSKKLGHIVSLFPNELWQMDIFIMQKYASTNRNYGYLFVIVDVFTRKAGAVPMKNKNASSCSDALETIMKKLGKPRIIMSDNDKAFLSKEFTNLIEKSEIILETNIKDDHKALGIIDRFARTLKTIISKYFLYIKSTKWIDQIDSIISIYNETPHKSLDYITPNQASQDSNYQKILDIN
jgi:putative transposase